MVQNFVGNGFSSTRYLPLVFTIFTLVFFSNFTGLIPYSTTPTTELVLTLGVSFTMLLGILVIGAVTHKAKLVAAFIPAGTPLGLMPLMILLELLAYTTRTLSLGLRLAVNLITGHILAKVVVGFLWLGVGAIKSSLTNFATFSLVASVVGFLVGFLAIWTTNSSSSSFMSKNLL
jgi:F-type H+-transporting ATPase subunit a